MPWPHLLLLFEPTGGEIHAYRPKSDFSLVSKTHPCNFLIGEVASEKNESDRWRMLLQATAAARVGRYLTKNNERPFILIAFYLTKELIVEQYLISQPFDDGKV